MSEAMDGVAVQFSRWFAAYSVVFWFKDAADIFSAVLTFPSENQFFASHFCRFDKDCYGNETS